MKTLNRKEEIVIVYIGSAECPSCQVHIGAFQKYFASEGFDDYVSQIYYLNSNNDLEGVTTMSELYPEVVASTPQLVVFKDGAVVNYDAKNH